MCDSANHRVVVFSTDGDLMFTFGSVGAEPGQFHEPLGICVREEKVFVCEGIGARLQVLDYYGRCWRHLPVEHANEALGSAAASEAAPRQCLLRETHGGDAGARKLGWNVTNEEDEVAAIS